MRNKTTYEPARAPEECQRELALRLLEVVSVMKTRYKGVWLSPTVAQVEKAGHALYELLEQGIYPNVALMWQPALPLDAPRHGECSMCGKEWDLNSEGRCSSCQTVWES